MNRTAPLNQPIFALRWCGGQGTCLVPATLTARSGRRVTIVVDGETVETLAEYITDRKEQP